MNNLVQSIPAEQLFQKGQLKGLLRSSFNKYLPKIIQNRKDKMGFPIPFDNFLKSKFFKDYLFDLFNLRKVRESGYFNKNLFENTLKNPGVGHRQLWSIISLSNLIKNYL